MQRALKVRGTTNMMGAKLFTEFMDRELQAKIVKIEAMIKNCRGNRTRLILS